VIAVARPHRGLVNEALDVARVRVHRTIRQWAEQEVILPDGPREGQRFSVSFSPFTGLVLDAYDDPRWNSFILTGSAQNSKSLIGFSIPTLYHLLEMAENVICLVPDTDFADSVWKEKLLPIIERTRYRDLIPSKGRGSKGGKFVFLRFRNGAVLRFINAVSAGRKRSGQGIGHTARIGVCTELDIVADMTEISKEPGPWKQLQARTKAYEERARIYAESVIHGPRDAAWVEIQRGTGALIMVPCPHCGEYIFPEREHLQKIALSQDSEEDAREKGGYTCQLCGCVWTENDRAGAVAAPLMVHRGQEVEGGKLVGQPPRVKLCSVRWNDMHRWSNPRAALDQTVVARISGQEWQAEESQSDEDEKTLCQHVWAVPWVPSEAESDDLSDRNVREKVRVLKPNNRDSEKGLVPADAKYITVYGDVHKRGLYWVARAWWPDARCHTFDYGYHEFHAGRQSENKSIMAGLLDWQEDVLSRGWLDTDDRLRSIDAAGADAHWKPDAVFAWVRTANGDKPKGIYHAGEGFGSGHMMRAYKQPKPGKTVIPGQHSHRVYVSDRRAWRLDFDADYWKRFEHELWLTPAGNPGSVTLFQPRNLKRGHFSYSKHIVAERWVWEWDAKKGRTGHFEREGSNNHYLDASTGTCVLASWLGVQVVADSDAPKKVVASYPERGERSGGGGWRIGR